MAALLAALVLAACKCHIAPLAAVSPPELTAQCSASIAAVVHEWAEFVVAPNLTYLGIWVGLRGYEKS
eukprot:27825-Pyramimonas_sp.AAC.1